MNVIKGTWKNGQVVLDRPAHWPEGCRVIIEPEINQECPKEEKPEDPEVIAKWLKEFDAIPPLQMTPEEEAQWQAARQAIKDYTLARMKNKLPSNE